MNILKYSPTQMDLTNPLDPNTVVPANRRYPPLDVRQSTKIGGMWTLKHEIISTRFYELLINIELKEETAMDNKNFYNHINMCVDAVTIL